MGARHRMSLAPSPWASPRCGKRTEMVMGPEAFRAGLPPILCPFAGLMRLCSLSWVLCPWHAALLAGPGSAAGQVANLHQEAGGV